MATIAITIPDLDSDLHAEAKASAATAKIPLKAWIKEAMREKLDHDNRRN